MSALRRLASRIGDEVGIVGLGTVFLLMAVVAGGATFGYAASHQNELAALRFEAVAQSALDNTGRALVSQGPVYVQDANGDGAIDSNDAISLEVTVAPGSPSIDASAIAVSLTTDAARYAITPTMTWTTGASDGQIKSGDTVELTFSPSAPVMPSERFAIVLMPTGGATTTVDVMMPGAIDGLMPLY